VPTVSLFPTWINDPVRLDVTIPRPPLNVLIRWLIRTASGPLTPRQRTAGISRVRLA
jgi:hypothetical protein